MYAGQVFFSIVGRAPWLCVYFKFTRLGLAAYTLAAMELGANERGEEYRANESNDSD